ncbi:hypothetical protein [Desulforamulus ruminis]|uniref:Lipoprotein n=1 Tax=Desulforamulus ruminis (strain ATCC 23193 / DSM 2154 / NCIMB 8452 / DL) TaxID=696281 RepID=F6DTD9_DESRL|nr:hypothetical protein [Desulforamulus ruminis]AEG58956.1 hypothetical protein Desru_0671 [Desulforamulus ruminis DSM 2154]
MNKKLASMIVGAALLGCVVGAVGDHYYYITKPQKIAAQEAQKQQERLNQMVRHAKVIEVKPDQLVVHVIKSGNGQDEGKKITVSIDDRTNIQKGNELLNGPMMPPVDLTKELRPEMKVDLMVDQGNKAVALYWEPDNIAQ